MPKGLSNIGKDMDEGIALPGDPGYEPLTQTIRIGGVIERVPVGQSPESEFDPEGIVDDDVLSDTRMSGVGQHDPEDGVQGGRRSPLGGRFNRLSEINDVINEWVEANSTFYHVGWERDPDFVDVTANLVADEYGYDVQEIKQAIASR